MSAFLIPGEGCNPARPDPSISSGLFLAHLRHLQQLPQAPALMQQWHYWCSIHLHYNLTGIISGRKVKIHNVAIPSTHSKSQPLLLHPVKWPPWNPALLPLLSLCFSVALEITYLITHLHNRNARGCCPFTAAEREERSTLDSRLFSGHRVLVSQKTCISPTYIILSLWDLFKRKHESGHYRQLKF